MKQTLFYALNVGTGDAFYLQRPDFSLLVDGGKRRRGFATRVQRVVGRRFADVVVCTHADDDHTNGLIDYFASEGQAGACWLPGRWVEVLDDVLGKEIDEYARAVLKDVERSGKALDSDGPTPESSDRRC